MASEYGQKIERFNKIREDLKAIVAAAEQAGGKLSSEHKAQFEKLAAEAQTLKTEILSADPLIQSKQILEELEHAADAPRPMPLSLDQVPRDIEVARNELELGRNRGRQPLRWFTPFGTATPEARLKNEQAALLSGLVLLARASDSAHREWALARLAAHGIISEKLAAIAPFHAEGGNDQGGYLVFPELEARIIDLKEQYGGLRRNAYNDAMVSETKSVPRRAGGTTVYYPDENTQIPSSAMKFDRVTMIAKKYAQLSLWSSELDEDAVVRFMDILAAEMAYQFAKAEDFNGTQGDGTSAYAGVVGFLQALAAGKNGIVPTASLVKVASGHAYTTPAAWLAGQNTAQLLAVFNALIGQLPIYAEGRAKIYAHKTVFWNMVAPIIEAAGGNIANFMVGGLPLKFLGYDVELLQSMPTFSQVDGASTSPALTIPLALGDLGMTVYMGTRRKITTKTSSERFIELDMLTIQMTQRVAITSVVGDSVDPLRVAGPMVAIQLPAT